MDIRVDGKKILITGGTGSVGRALVEVFSLNGGSVHFLYKQRQDYAAYLVDTFGATSLQIDLGEEFSLPVASNYDILINNAGINLTKQFAQDISYDIWEKTIRVNLTASYLLTQHCLPFMQEQGWGRIINICSIYGLRSVSMNLPYTVSKHGLSGLTKTIAKEYAIHGITCNEICPGPIDSELMERIAQLQSLSHGISRDEYFRQACEAIPAGRFAKPEEIAYLALYLASEVAAYINGVSIPIDGGRIA